MILDPHGRALTRRKHFGFTRGPREYVLADPEPVAELELCDAIGTEHIPVPGDEPDTDQEITIE